MTHLDEADPLRFSLTQSHKTFGILILLLACLRLLWRLTHKAPDHPADAPRWEKFAASSTHLAFYALMFALPLTGWAAVSVSTLNIDTLLFDRIEWPHLPILEWLNITELASQERIEHQLKDAHEITGGVLILLILLHVGAALKHHFINKDDVLRRMQPRFKERSFQALLGALILGIGAAAFGLTQLGQSNPPPLVAGNSLVTLEAQVSGAATSIVFASSTVVANISTDNPSDSTLTATVETAGVTSDNLQVQGSLPDADWFDSENYPQASFKAVTFNDSGVPNQLDVTGTFTVKETTLPISFALKVTPGEDGESTKASAEFPVDRFELQLGLISQPNEDYVKAPVIVRVDFELSSDQ